MVDLDFTELEYGPGRVDPLVFDEETQGMIVLQELWWQVFVDGSSCRSRAGVGVVVLTLKMEG